MAEQTLDQNQKRPQQQQQRPRKRGAHLDGNGMDEDYPRCIGRMLNEVQHSYALHARQLKELVALRRRHAQTFLEDWWRTLQPAMLVQRREPAVERVMRFAAVFAAFRDGHRGGGNDECDAFLEEFFGVLLFCTDAASKAVRFRACQLLSEILLRLPDDAEVSNEAWDAVIAAMQRRLRDRAPVVRVFAARALARFAGDPENAEIVSLYRDALAVEQNPEVRKMIVFSMPPSNETAVDIIERTLDVNDSVRKAAYRVLANKFPIRSLSIKQRTTILRRGLADRVPSVTIECEQMLKNAWFAKCCEREPIILLKCLDVETNESVGIAVLELILKSGLVKFNDGQSIRQFLISEQSEENEDHFQKPKLMDAETALYWRMLCRQLQLEAQEKGADAASTQGTEAAVYAAEAAEKNELLDSILPSTVAEYVQLVEAHILAGPKYSFASRQLLLLGLMLEYSDATSRKVASTFLQKLFYKPIEHTADDENGKIAVIGDGVSLGGDKGWAKAVTELTRKVHASEGEFEDTVSTVVEELGRPCREGAADFLQWLHCLSMCGLLLENIKSVQRLRGTAIGEAEILHGLLVPAAKHIHEEVRRAAVRCLGLYGLKQRKPCEEVVRELRLAFGHGPSSVRKMAAKALFDLCMFHGSTIVDKAVNIGTGLSPSESNVTSASLPGEDNEGEIIDSTESILDMLSSGLVRDEWSEDLDMIDMETTWGILAEGFAKLLLQSKRYCNVESMQCFLFTKLICLYFSDETKDLYRLRQCLTVFFDQYAAVSADHKKCISKSFIPVMRSVWPGVYGNASGNSHTVSSLRKRATNVSLFMVELLKAPLFVQSMSSATQNDSDSVHDDDGEERPATTKKEAQLEVDVGMEQLAIRIAVEVASFPSKKTAAERSYVAALCKVAALLDFRPSEQEAIKCMRKLLNHMVEIMSWDKQLVKDLEGMMTRLKALDQNPDEGLPDEQLKFILGNLDLEKDIDIESILEDPVPAPSAKTPGPRRAMAPKRRSRRARSPDSSSPISLETSTPCTTRAQRVSKTAAMGKMKNSSSLEVDVDRNDDIDEDELRLISTATDGEESSDSADTDYEVEGDEEVQSALRKTHAHNTKITENSSDHDNNPSENENADDEDNNRRRPARKASQNKKSFKSQTTKKGLAKLSDSTLTCYSEDDHSDLEVAQKKSVRASTRSRTRPNRTVEKQQSKKPSENIQSTMDSISGVGDTANS